MTVCAEGDQIFASVIPQFASETEVVHLKTILPAAILALPAIPFQDLPMKLFVGWPVQLEAWTFFVDQAHAGIFRRDENVCLSSSGSNSYSFHSESNMACGD